MTLKLKRTPGLYLVGFMGSGKSTVGQILAEELGWCFCDIDQEIEREHRKTIAQIFAERGELEFREVEHAAIRRHVASIEVGNPCVIALGGGAFAQARNLELLENNGVSVWLDCSLERVCERIGCDPSRPLTADPVRFEQLYNERRPFYACADFRIDAETDDPAEVVRRILQLPLF